MTDTPRKTPEHNPWWICKEFTDNDTVPPIERREELQQQYQSLADCEAECRKLALASPGVTFTPVKYGRPFTASKVEKVVLA